MTIQRVVFYLREKTPPPLPYVKILCPACKGKNLSTGLFNDTLRECFLCPQDGYFLMENRDYFTLNPHLFGYAFILRLFRLR